MALDALDDLIRLLSKMPGLGPRSARRAVLHLLKDKHRHLAPLVSALQTVEATIKPCSTCGNVDVTDPCKICTNPNRDKTVLCVVEDVADLWALERSASYRGLYHVLGGTLSALEDRGPEDIRLPDLIQRAKDADPTLTEVILALNATVEGQTTSHYIAESFQDHAITCKLSRPSVGLPLGGEYDYMDDGTITTALTARQKFCA